MPTITPDANVSFVESLLNPLLVTALSLAFPEQREQIRISRAGQRRVLKGGPLGYTLPPQEHGEGYVLDCPFCGDSRGRMRVSYAYDPGQSNFRWYCFNEHCQQSPQNQVDLANRLQAVWLAAKEQLANGQLPPALRSVVPAEEDSGPIIAELPEGFVPLRQLREDHPARGYVHARQFHPDILSEYWGVGYSEQSLVPSPRFERRIVIPFYHPSPDGSGLKLIGWQARCLNACPSSAKYLTMEGLRKTRLLYSAPYGIAPSDKLIIAEGVADVWRLGMDAVGILGKVASPHQIQLVVEAARHRRAILVALDADAEPEATKLMEQLQRALKSAGLSIPVVRCRPRHQPDFGACNIYEAGQAIDDAMAAAANTMVSHAAPPRHSAVANTGSDGPRTRGELAERLVLHATSENYQLPFDAEARVAELGMIGLLDGLEEPLLPILAEIERVGLKVDRTRLNEIISGDSSLQSAAESLIKSLSPEMGRIHTTLDALGGRTGRITSRRFCLHSLNRPLRSAIVADDGRQLICADFSQFEWRQAAAISGDARVLSWCADPSIDLYVEVASLLLEIRRENVSQQARAPIKHLMMRFLFSLRNYDPNDEPLWRHLVDLFPDLMAWRERHVAESIQAGFVRTPMGRMIAIDRDSDQETLFNRAVNNVIQGAGADVFKAALLAVRRSLPPDVRLMLPHHDAILLDTPVGLVEEIIPLLESAMQTPPPGYPIPFPCKIHAGANWGVVTGC